MSPPIFGSRDAGVLRPQLGTKGGDELTGFQGDNMEPGEIIVSGKEGLPQMDLSVHGGKGYDPINELMRAIILRTIEDYNSGGELHAEAVAYMNGDEGDEESDFDAGNEELTYQDPFSRSRRVAAVVDLRGHSLRNWLEMNVASPLLHRGSLICFEHVKIEGVGDNIPLVGVAVGGTRAELLPIGVAGSPYLYPRENERPDLEQIARYSGVILVKQPERLKQCIAFFWLALGLFLLALGLWSPGAAARMKILFLSLSLMVFSALSLFLFNNP